MIAYLKGRLLLKEANLAVLDVNGVGYEVHIPLSTYYGLSELGQEATFYIHTHVREDIIQLFGFRTQLEKELFLRLISVSGVGPKVALTVLSGLSTEELIQAIIAGNLVKLTAIPGIGRKTAERLIMELRDRVKNLSTGVVAEAGSSAVKADLVSALVNLGWQQAMAEKAVIAAIKEEQRQDFEWLLKQSMKKLYNR